MPDNTPASPPSPAVAPRFDRFAHKHLDAEDYINLLESQVRTLQGELADARSLANRWIKAALYATPIATLAFDPTDPESFAESRRDAVDRLMADSERLAALQGELEEMREARWFAMKTGFVLGATDYTVIGKDSEVIVLAGEALVRREREFEAHAALSSKTETPP